MKKILFIIPVLLLCGCFHKFQASNGHLSNAFRKNDATLTYTKEASECINYNLFSFFSRIFYQNDNFTVSDIAKKEDIKEIVDITETTTNTLFNFRKCITVRGN